TTPPKTYPGRPDSSEITEELSTFLDTAQTALATLAEFESSAWGAKYPQTVATRTAAWERFIPFLQFPPMLRRVIYTRADAVGYRDDP
ncbi:transposase, partial [Dietzia aerolata]